VTLAAVGAACLGATLGWAGARPRGIWAPAAEAVLALAAGFAAVLLLFGMGSATVVAAGTIAGFGLRLLLDLYLSRVATQGRR
jgi:hypothetical protein